MSTYLLLRVRQLQVRPRLRWMKRRSGWSCGWSAPCSRPACPARMNAPYPAVGEGGEGREEGDGGKGVEHGAEKRVFRK